MPRAGAGDGREDSGVTGRALREAHGGVHAHQGADGGAAGQIVTTLQFRTQASLPCTARCSRWYHQVKTKN